MVGIAPAKNLQLNDKIRIGNLEFNVTGVYLRPVHKEVYVSLEYKRDARTGSANLLLEEDTMVNIRRMRVQYTTDQRI